MTERRQPHQKDAPRHDFEAKWANYLAQPIAVRQAIQEKVAATLRTQGVQAGRDMMRAMGMPVPPASLCLPADVVEARQEAHEGEAFDPALGRLDH